MLLARTLITSLFCLSLARAGAPSPLATALPGTMQAIAIDHYGGIELLGERTVPGPAEFARLNQALESMATQVPIDSEFALADARAAHQRLAAGHLLGKVILRVQ